MSSYSAPQYRNHRAAGHWNPEQQQFQEGSGDVQSFADAEGFEGVMNPSAQGMPRDPAQTSPGTYHYTEEHLQFPSDWPNNNDDGLQTVSSSQYPSIIVDGETMERQIDEAAQQSRIYRDPYRPGATFLAALDHFVYGPSSSLSDSGNYGPWNPLEGLMGHEGMLDGSSAHQHGISSPQFSSRVPSQDEHSSGSNAVGTSASVVSGNLIPADLEGRIMIQQPIYLSTENVSGDSAYRYSVSVDLPYGSQTMMAPQDVFSMEPEHQSSGRLAMPSLDVGWTTEALTPAASSIVESQSTGSEIQCKYEGCFQTFTGTHRRGTMHRHMRLKHFGAQGAPERMFICEVASCGKSFKRQDARLKHLRNKHPELGYAAAMPRKS